MRKIEEDDNEELGVLEDKTEALPLRSKRTERAKLKAAKRATKARASTRDITSLPYELLLEVLRLLRPSDLFCLIRTSRALRDFILPEAAGLGDHIMQLRYPSLARCFRLPVLLEKVPSEARGALLNPERWELAQIRDRPYQHIESPDPTLICTCWTCMLRWSGLCVVVDFAHWRRELDERRPITIIPRGTRPEWNRLLNAKHAAIARRALREPLWHARLLEAHLDTTVRAIRWHAANKGNQRKRFRMTDQDVRLGTDAFLERSGPPTHDFPFHRDNYYLLEAYLPGRAWSKEEQRWWYVSESQHNTDIGFVLRGFEQAWRAKVARAQPRAVKELWAGRPTGLGPICERRGRRGRALDDW